MRTDFSVNVVLLFTLGLPTFCLQNTQDATISTSTNALFNSASQLNNAAINVKQTYDHADYAAWCQAIETGLARYSNNPSRRLWSAITHALENGGTSAPVDEVTNWMARKCNATMWLQYNALAPYPSCRRRTMSKASGSGPNACLRGQGDVGGTLQHVAIMMGVTSRNVKAPSTSSLALFTLSLPGIVKTVECGFRYTVLVGYDVGDAFYDTTNGQAAMTQWFDRHVHRPLNQRGIDVDLIRVRVNNPVAKPGPVFNAVAQRAHAIKADFFYRVNDDTLMLTPWTTAFVGALCSLSPPYGVVGPVETEHADILTHDFVHRTHIDIFGDYYPPSLTDWWMDDWISKVYGPPRSLRVTNVKTLHMTRTHGQRYSVDKTHERLLQPLLESGRSRIQDYVAVNLNKYALNRGGDVIGGEYGDVTAQPLVWEWRQRAYSNFLPRALIHADRTEQALVAETSCPYLLLARETNTKRMVPEWILYYRALYTVVQFCQDSECQQRSTTHGRHRQNMYAKSL